MNKTQRAACKWCSSDENVKLAKFDQETVMDVAELPDDVLLSPFCHPLYCKREYKPADSAELQNAEIAFVLESIEFQWDVSKGEHFAVFCDGSN